MSKKNDRGLRFFHEVLGLEHLHYGMWLPDDDLTLEKLKEAQQRYEDHLIGTIPEGTKRVLDVGCGTSAMVQRMVQMGFAVEGLSPDDYQKKLFAERVKAPFHHCLFEHFRTDNPFDCIVMSESAQYIKIEYLLQTSACCLASRGHLLVCDYFVSKGATGVLAKSGHDLDEFISEATANDFTLVRQEDITDSVTKTLDIGRLCVDKILLAADIGTESIRARHPLLTRFTLWLFRRRIAKVAEQIELLDSEKFKANKRYLLLLLQRNGG